MTLPKGVVEGSTTELPVTSAPDGAVALEIDRTIFSVDALLRAAYKFTDRYHVFIQTHRTQADRWSIAFHRKPEAHVPEQVAGEFANELIDQQLRQRLEQQFSDVRTLIVAQAFSEGNLLDPAGQEGDYQTDPKGIGRLRP